MGECGRRGGLAAWLAFATLGSATAFAQRVALDGTLGPPAALSGPSYDIQASYGRQVGGNLFHSFGRFGLIQGESATFSGPGSVNHIVARVTGGETSSIDGTLRSAIPGASLYLINPRGIAFGPNASLDLQGSFYASTADYLKLGSSGTFHATHPAASVLTSAPPSAFGFLGPAPAAISVTGSELAVPDGKSFALVGGDLLLSGVLLNAVGGAVQLASLAGAGETTPGAAGISLPEAAALGRIDIAGSVLNASSGETNRFLDEDIRNTSLAAGAIHVLGGRLGMTDSTLASVNSAAEPGGGISLNASESIHLSRLYAPALTTINYGQGTGGTIAISAPLIELDGRGSPFTDYATIDASTWGPGNAGSVRIDAGTLRMVGNASVTTSTYAQGAGGEILVRASNAVSISGRLSGTLGGGLFSDVEDCGAQCGSAGRVFVEAPSIEVNDAYITSETFASGNAGSVEIRAGRLTVSAGGAISTSVLGAASGNAGALSVQADRVEIVAGPTLGSYPTGLYSASESGTAGNAGSLSVSAGEIDVSGGVIASTSRGAGHGGNVSVRAGSIVLRDGAKVVADTELSGAGGSVDVQATGAIDIAGASARTDSLGGASGVFARTFGSGAGGTVRVAANTLSLRDGGLVSASSAGTGRAGDVSVAVDKLLMVRGSIATETITSDGGSILIRAGSLVYLKDSAITTSVAAGTGSGGNILIDPIFVVLDNSRIIANASRGSGGNIDIIATYYLKTPDSVVQASSELGESGAITISSPNLSVGPQFQVLPGAYVDAAALMGQACGERAGQQASRFTRTGRGGLPLGPDAMAFASYGEGLCDNGSCPRRIAVLRSASALPTCPRRNRKRRFSSSTARRTCTAHSTRCPS